VVELEQPLGVYLYLAGTDSSTMDVMRRLWCHSVVKRTDDNLELCLRDQTYLSLTQLDQGCTFLDNSS